MHRGYFQTYTGNGKGKSSAAFGMAVRAAGAGIRVFIAQFVKKGDFSEIIALSRFSDLIDVKQFGTGRFVGRQPGEEDRTLAENCLRESEDRMLSGNYGLIILDEANCAVSLGLVSIESLLAFAVKKPGNVELIITGRNAHPKLVEMADLVTEMTEVKHYAKAGVPARKGFEF